MTSPPKRAAKGRKHEAEALAEIHEIMRGYCRDTPNGIVVQFSIFPHDARRIYDLSKPRAASKPKRVKRG